MHLKQMAEAVKQMKAAMTTKVQRLKKGVKTRYRELYSPKAFGLLGGEIFEEQPTLAKARALVKGLLAKGDPDLLPAVGLLHLLAYSPEVEVAEGGKIARIGLPLQDLLDIPLDHQKMAEHVPSWSQPKNQLELGPRGTKNLIGQLSLSEEFISQVLLQVDVNPKLHSLHGATKYFPYAEPLLSKYSGFLTTAILGKVLPTLAAEHGDNKLLDVMMTANHEVIKEGLPGAEISGLYIADDGSLRIVLNMHVDLSLAEDGDGKSVRHLYFSIEAKAKATESEYVF